MDKTSQRSQRTTKPTAKRNAKRLNAKSIANRTAKAAARKRHSHHRSRTKPNVVRTILQSAKTTNIHQLRRTRNHGLWFPSSNRRKSRLPRPSSRGHSGRRQLHNDRTRTSMLRNRKHPSHRHSAKQLRPRHGRPMATNALQTTLHGSEPRQNTRLRQARRSIRRTRIASDLNPEFHKAVKTALKSKVTTVIDVPIGSEKTWFRLCLQAAAYLNK